MDTQLAEKITAIVASVTRREPEAIRPEATFDELGIDSLDRINILFELEEKFNISIPDEEARDIKTVQQMTERMGTYLQSVEPKAG